MNRKKRFEGCLNLLFSMKCYPNLCERVFSMWITTGKSSLCLTLFAFFMHTSDDPFSVHCFVQQIVCTNVFSIILTKFKRMWVVNTKNYRLYFSFQPITVPHSHHFRAFFAKYKGSDFFSGSFFHPRTKIYWSFFCFTGTTQTA